MFIFSTIIHQYTLFWIGAFVIKLNKQIILTHILFLNFVTNDYFNQALISSMWYAMWSAMWYAIWSAMWSAMWYAMWSAMWYAMQLESFMSNPCSP